MTTRRQFLTGLLASVAAPALPKISIDTETVPLRGPERMFSVADELHYMNFDSSYGAVYTPWFKPAGLQRGVIENVRALSFFDDVEIGDKFIVAKTKFVETEMTVADVRRRELSYSNLFHKDPEFDQAMDDYIGALNGNSGDEAQGHVEGREAVCDPVGQDERRKTV